MSNDPQSPSSTPAARPDGAAPSTGTPDEKASSTPPAASARTSSDKPQTAPAKATAPSPETKKKAAKATTAPKRGKTARSGGRAAAGTRAATGTRTATGARATAGRAAASRAATAGTTAARARAAAVRTAATTTPSAPSPAAAQADGERAGRAYARLNADVTSAGRNAGRTVVDAVEGAGDRLAEYQEQIARATPLPWVADFARANAGFTRAATRAYAGTVRSLLRD